MVQYIHTNCQIIIGTSDYTFAALARMLYNRYGGARRSGLANWSYFIWLKLAYWRSLPWLTVWHLFW